MTKETLTRKQRIAEFEDEGYNIMVTGRHVHVTDAMKAYAVEKLSKLDRFADRIIDIAVIMDIQKLEHRVDIVMKYGHTIIKSHAATGDMYVSLDQAVHKLQNQLRRYKSRLKDHHAKGHPVGELAATIYSPIDEVEINQGIESLNDYEEVGQLQPHKIVKSETQPLKILTDDEAIMKMELSGKPAMVYRNEETRRLKVIYRLEDGNYCVIEAE
ncbi:MAG: ribosome-associated translation inhibitor RaiA [Verrucomicrobia bacterium]|nr:ribosome-associated translation inhibitor RaiA [Verrucomicrobiota bacterium]MBS0637539.1 ribosome-associated translation inhibitor RaiA [Verrucomicrobiota bacterium]